MSDRILAAVIVRSGSPADALDAIAAQVYEAAEIVVVGGGADVQAVASQRQVRWVGSIAELLDLLDASFSHVWFLHDDAMPRPDALRALVTEADRVDASVAGVKLLSAADPATLELVGGATDVYGTPYTGLEPGERDQEQYDVLRDVAYISGACMLVRRDLFRGLGGPDVTMPPEAAGIDFSQRARAAGGRVVVVPSAEVLHRRSCVPASPWREQAGRIRAMIKTYQAVTLAWALPGAFAVGFLDAVTRTFLDGPRALLDFVLAWLWNLKRLPSTVAARKRMARSRLVGDEELFRFQVRGSVALRVDGERVAERLREREGRLPDWAQRGFWQQPGFITGGLGLVFVALATRSVWADGLPVTGLAAPLPESAWATLQLYAGGWNPGGLGSAFPLHPSVAAASVVQLVLLSKGGLAAAVLTAGSLALGMAGAGRMLGRLGVGRWGRAFGALAFVGGPAARLLTDTGLWPQFIGLGLVPWAVLVALEPWPEGVRRRLARLAGLSLAAGLLGSFTPLGGLVPTVFLVVLALLVGSWGRPLRAGVGFVLGLPLLLPWIYAVSLPDLVGGGRSVFWEPSWWVVGLVLGVAALTVIVADRAMAGLAGTGAVLAAVGAVLARTAGLGWGLEPAAAGLVAASLGTAVVVGAAVSTTSRLADARLPMRILAAAGALGALVVASGALLLLVDGAVGIGPDRYGTPLEFAAARAADHGVDRLLVAGPPEDLPGVPVIRDGYGYVVFGGPSPDLTEVWSGPPGLGDAALDALLDEVETGEVLRPGARLAEFGIRWVVLIGDTPIAGPLESQLDLRPLPGLDYVVYENEVPTARAVADDGQAWSWMPPVYEGPPASTVIVRENADPRWGPEWRQVDWANEVSGQGGVATFGPLPILRVLAEAAGVYLLVLSAGVIVGRRRR